MHQDPGQWYPLYEVSPESVRVRNSSRALVAFYTYANMTTYVLLLQYFVYKSSFAHIVNSLLLEIRSHCLCLLLLHRFSASSGLYPSIQPVSPALRKHFQFSHYCWISEISHIGWFFHTEDLSHLPLIKTNFLFLILNHFYISLFLIFFF